MKHWFSQQQSSFTAKMRNLRDASNVSDTKSNDQRSPGRKATGIGVRGSRARFLAPSLPDTQLFLSIEAVQLLMIHEHSFALQKHADLAIAKRDRPKRRKKPDLQTGLSFSIRLARSQELSGVL
jgi:hypothetical protein